VSALHCQGFAGKYGYGDFASCLATRGESLEMASSIFTRRTPVPYATSIPVHALRGASAPPHRDRLDCEAARLPARNSAFIRGGIPTDPRMLHVSKHVNRGLRYR